MLSSASKECTSPKTSSQILRCGGHLSNTRHYLHITHATTPYTICPTVQCVNTTGKLQKAKIQQAIVSMPNSTTKQRRVLPATKVPSRRLHAQIIPAIYKRQVQHIESSECQPRRVPHRDFTHRATLQLQKHQDSRLEFDSDAIRSGYLAAAFHTRHSLNAAATVGSARGTC